MLLKLLTLATLAQGLSGLAGGALLMVDPSGQTIGLPPGWLEDTPFPDYSIPGAILFTVLGLLPTGVAWALWTRRAWARTGALLVGAALVIWILVEVLMIGYQARPPLQAVYGALGVAILLLASRRSVRDRLRA